MSDTDVPPVTDPPVDPPADPPTDPPISDPVPSDPVSNDEWAAIIEQGCQVMHDAYETAAAAAGWVTQAASNTSWDTVPEACKEAMRAAVATLLAWDRGF